MYSVCVGFEAECGRTRGGCREQRLLLGQVVREGCLKVALKQCYLLRRFLTGKREVGDTPGHVRAYTLPPRLLAGFPGP